LKKILLFGAGRSATVLIDYLLKEAEKEIWKLVVVDADIALAKAKTNKAYNYKPSATCALVTHKEWK